MDCRGMVWFASLVPGPRRVACQSLDAESLIMIEARDTTPVHSNRETREVDAKRRRQTPRVNSVAVSSDPSAAIR